MGKGKRKMTAEDKQKAVEMLKYGLKYREIADALGLTYGQVYSLLRTNLFTGDGFNADRHLCYTCRYRTGEYEREKAGMNCNYICCTGHSRGCKSDKCTKYEKGRRIKVDMLATGDYDIRSVKDERKEILAKNKTAV